ncbi:DUF3796 domain-containing protein [Desulfosporosinus fructosivorans]
MKSKFNPLALVGLLGLFGFLGPLTGRELWYWWFAWFVWFTHYNEPTDERFFANLYKVGLPCFAMTMLGLMVLLFMKGLAISQDIIYSGIELVFTVALLSFVLVLKYFEVYGE